MTELREPQPLSDYCEHGVDNYNNCASCDADTRGLREAMATIQDQVNDGTRPLH